MITLNVSLPVYRCNIDSPFDYRCCNTCEEVREAYRKKGWAFNNPEGIEQCDREGWTDKMMSQKNEGCQVLGYLQVNKASSSDSVKEYKDTLIPN